MQLHQLTLAREQEFSHELASWKDYWHFMSYPWRTEPEIPVARQKELLQALTTPVDSERGIFPFNTTISKLSRADLEWLLTHQRLRGHITQGLDLRGVDLRGVDLYGLPLTGIRGGLSREEWLKASDEQRERAALHLEHAYLRAAHLEGANLCGAHLEGTDLREAELDGANLAGAHLAMTNLSQAHLQDADLSYAHLEGKEGFPGAAILREAHFSSTTQLDGIILGNETYGFAPLADIEWNGVSITGIDWTTIPKLGDELANRWRMPVEYLSTIRSYRQVSDLLEQQGLKEQADHYRYRAHVNEHKLILQRALLPVALRHFVRERMPLPKWLYRLQERRVGENIPRHILLMASLRFAALLIPLLVLAFYQPFIVLALLFLVCGGLLGIALLVRRRKHANNPFHWQQVRVLPPPGLRSPQQRRRDQWTVLVGSQLGVPRKQDPSLLQIPENNLVRWPYLQRLNKTQPQRATALLMLVALFLLFDDTLRRCGQYAISLLLYGLTGFGYKLKRTLFCYITIIVGFTALIMFLGQITPEMALFDSLMFFHNPVFLSGFFSGTTQSSLSNIAAIESLIGLIIEISVIVMLTQRFYRK